MATPNSACALCTFQHLIFPCPSFRSKSRSPAQNYVRPWRAAIKYPVTTHDAVQLSEVERVGVGIERLVYLTGRQETSLSGILLVSLQKRFMRKDIWRVSSMGKNDPPTPGVTTWTNTTAVGRKFSDQSMLSACVGAPPRPPTPQMQSKPGLPP